MSYSYKVNQAISTHEFIELLASSRLSERRPSEDEAGMQGMIENSNLLVTAWDENQLIGVARSLTDFHYACYLSDLGVHKRCQNHGIGRKLIQITQDQLGTRCKLILVSAPDAMSFYKHIGLNLNDRCWTLEAGKFIK